MKKTINLYEFRNAFRGTENFSYAGLEALYNHFENYESETNTEIELDVIGFCCEFAEYENLDEFKKDCDHDIDSIDDIYDYTTVIPIDNSDGFLVSQF